MRTFHTLSLGLFTASLLALAPRTANAAEDTAAASPTGKGITGGALLGAEVVMLTEAAFKVKPAWAYAVGGLAGGIGGGVGGYFIEHSASDGNGAKGPMYMLAGGMALIIPTVVAVLSASAYEPPADFTEDKGPSDEPVAEPPHAAPTPGPAAAPPGPGEAPPPPPAATPAPAGGTPEGTPPAAPPPQAKRTVIRHHLARTRPPTLYVPPAVVGVGGSGMALAFPAVELRQVYSRADIMQYGVKQAMEVRIPVVNFLF